MTELPKTLVPSSYLPSTSMLTPPALRDHGLWLIGSEEARRIGWARLQKSSPKSPATFVAPAPRNAYRIAKRCADVLVSSLLLLLLLPLFLVLALLVLLDTPGPSLFHQDRIGLNGRRFVIWKFRSMRVESPRYERSPMSGDDSRLTRVGRIIRSMSLDELPQLVNVLKGDMSLVGPRPEMPFIAEQYTAGERMRLTVKPGITGLWQISSARLYPIHHHLEYDLHYIHHQNIILDAMILIRTLEVVACRKQAI